jgi:hypothetical protein
LKSRMFLWKKMNTTLSGSKSLARFQKYVHRCIKACLIRRYIHRVWGQVKMTSIPVPRTAKYTEYKGYHSITLLSFVHGTMQKLMDRNIRGESLGQVP